MGLLGRKMEYLNYNKDETVELIGLRKPFQTGQSAVLPLPWGMGQ